MKKCHHDAAVVVWKMWGRIDAHRFRESGGAESLGSIPVNVNNPARPIEASGTSSLKPESYSINVRWNSLLPRIRKH
jgi:hypothetical protein